jgi:uncharacterized membrane protein
VPLSEDEQRILSEIEQRLYESDPDLANEVRSTTVYTDPARSLRWAILGCVVGLIIMIATLSISYWFAFAGFMVMFGSALYVERSLRRLGKVSIDQIAQNIRSRPVRGFRGFRTESESDDD